MAIRTSQNKRKFSMDSMVVAAEPVPVEQIPHGTHAMPGTKRRWQELCERIREVSPEQSIKVTLRTATDAETVRQGVSAELKRFGKSSRVRSVLELDGSATLWFVAIDRTTKPPA